MVNRRRFLAGCCTLPLIPRGSVALPYSTEPIPSYVNAATHLDLSKAQAIADQWIPEPDAALDLSRYRTATVEALDLLAPTECAFLELGLCDLTSPVAGALSNAVAHYLIFSRLETLTPEATTSLVAGTRGHALEFQRLIDLTPEVARLLVESPSGSRYLGIVMSGPVTTSLATVLAQHGHDLVIYMRDHSLDVSAARELSFHRGEWLTVNNRYRFSDCILDALTANPKKHLSLHKSDAPASCHMSSDHLETWVATIHEDESYRFGWIH